MKDVKSDRKEIVDQANAELSAQNVTAETVREINDCVEHANDIVKETGEILSEVVKASIDSGAI